MEDYVAEGFSLPLEYQALGAVEKVVFGVPRWAIFSLAPAALSIWIRRIIIQRRGKLMIRWSGVPHP
jgi:hypothetical protein